MAAVNQNTTIQTVVKARTMCNHTEQALGATKIPKYLSRTCQGEPGIFVACPGCFDVRSHGGGISPCCTLQHTGKAVSDEQIKSE